MYLDKGTISLPLGDGFGGRVDDRSACKVPERVGVETDDLAHTDPFQLGDRFWGVVDDRSVCNVQEMLFFKPMTWPTQIHSHWVISFGVEGDRSACKVQKGGWC